MHLIVDTHAHIYNCYSLDSFLYSSFNNLKRLQSNANNPLKVLCLTQSENNSPDFESIKKQVTELKNFKLGPKTGVGVIQILDESNDQLFILNGLQIVSDERLEILAIATNLNSYPKGTTEEVIDHIIGQKMMPILPWSPGKWSGKRGLIVSGLIDKYRRDQIAFGDIMMRPKCIGSEVLAKAEAKGFNIFAGSDTLPMKGEEALSGRFASVFEVDDSFELSIESLQAVLFKSNPKAMGAKNSVFKAIGRWLMLRINKK